MLRRTFTVNGIVERARVYVTSHGLYEMHLNGRRVGNQLFTVYAYLYLELARLGIDVAAESQLVGYPTQFPSVSMVDWNKGQPNARYWVLKLLRNNFGPGDKFVDTRLDLPAIACVGSA